MHGQPHIRFTATNSNIDTFDLTSPDLTTVKEYKLNYWHLDSRMNTVWCLWSDNKGCSILVYVYLQRPLAFRGAILAIATHCRALSVRRPYSGHSAPSMPVCSKGRQAWPLYFRP